MQMTTMCMAIGLPITAYAVSYGYETTQHLNLLRNASLDSYTLTTDNTWEKASDCSTFNTTGDIYKKVCSDYKPSFMSPDIVGQYESSPQNPDPDNNTSSASSFSIPNVECHRHSDIELQPLCQEKDMELDMIEFISQTNNYLKARADDRLKVKETFDNMFGNPCQRRDKKFRPKYCGDDQDIRRLTTNFEFQGQDEEDVVATLLDAIEFDNLEVLDPSSVPGDGLTDWQQDDDGVGYGNMLARGYMQMNGFRVQISIHVRNMRNSNNLLYSDPEKSFIAVYGAFDIPTRSAERHTKRYRAVLAINLNGKTERSKIELRTKSRFQSTRYQPIPDGDDLVEYMNDPDKPKSNREFIKKIIDLQNEIQGLLWINMPGPDNPPDTCSFNPDGGNHDQRPPDPGLGGGGSIGGGGAHIGIVGGGC